MHKMELHQKAAEPVQAKTRFVRQHAHESTRDMEKVLNVSEQDDEVCVFVCVSQTRSKQFLLMNIDLVSLLCVSLFMPS
jgi:hypothetical protein